MDNSTTLNISSLAVLSLYAKVKAIRHMCAFNFSTTCHFAADAGYAKQPASKVFES